MATIEEYENRVMRDIVRIDGGVRKVQRIQPASCGAHREASNAASQWQVRIPERSSRRFQQFVENVPTFLLCQIGTAESGIEVVKPDRLSGLHGHARTPWGRHSDHRASKGPSSLGAAWKSPSPRIVEPILSEDRLVCPTTESCVVSWHLLLGRERLTSKIAGAPDVTSRERPEIVVFIGWVRRQRTGTSGYPKAAP